MHEIVLYMVRYIEHYMVRYIVPQLGPQEAEVALHSAYLVRYIEHYMVRYMVHHLGPLPLPLPLPLLLVHLLTYVHKAARTSVPRRQKLVWHWLMGLMRSKILQTLSGGEALNFIDPVRYGQKFSLDGSCMHTRGVHGFISHVCTTICMCMCVCMGTTHRP